MRLLLAGLLLGFSFAAEAQQPAPPVTLTLSVERVMLITQVLSKVGCQDVAALQICQEALATLTEIKNQVREQQK